MKNIITIDFDIIMKPSINIYNDQAPNLNWLQFNRMPEIQLLRADISLYQKLTTFLYQLIKITPLENIHFIEDHSQTVSFITEPCNLFNIDHHHDTGYEKNNYARNNPVPNTDIGCGNWVRWLFEQKLINSYIWLNNNNSTKYSLKEEMVNKIIDIAEYDLNQLLFTPDALILCLSEPWLPPQYRPLYYLWKDYCEFYFNTKDIDIIYGKYNYY